MKAKATIFTLASDDDDGTKAEVFTNERLAVLALLDKLKGDPDDEERKKLIEAYFDPAADPDFYELISEFKSEYDTYSIDWHELELEVWPLDAPEQGALTDAQKQDIADNHGQVSYKGWEAV